MDSTRVDKWLWAVRAYKTRSAASTACQAGHVDVNGSGAKPATSVRVGDRVTVRVAGRVRDLEVAQVIDKRVGAALAADCLVDHSPPPPAAGVVLGDVIKDAFPVGLSHRPPNDLHAVPIR